MAGTRFGILAGYDGSPDADQALRWAARQAAARKVILTACHSWDAGIPAQPGARDMQEAARRHGEAILARAAEAASGLIDDAVSNARLVLADEPAAAALCDRSAAAEMTVVGPRGLGGLTGMLLGSVSTQVAEHGHGQVVVVRGRWLPAAQYLPGSVVVGGDGSAASAAAVEFAFEEAALRDAPLVAVCALADAAGSVGGSRQVEDAFEQVLGRCEKENPEVIVHRRVTCAAPRGALLATAADVQAQLLVLGARGRGGLSGMLLGSVSHAALRHAPCPVAVVHGR